MGRARNDPPCSARPGSRSRERFGRRAPRSERHSRRCSGTILRRRRSIRNLAMPLSGGKSKVRALSYEGPYKVKVARKPDPGIEHPNDIILKVTRAAICGSDLHLLHGYVPDTRVGCTFGHEFTGVVEETGSSVTTLRKGDRVVVPFNISCGSSFYCQP